MTDDDAAAAAHAGPTSGVGTRAPEATVSSTVLAAQLGVDYERLRRWMLYLGRWRHVGPGRRQRLTAADVVAVTVALAVAGDDTTGTNQGAAAITRATGAGDCAAEAPDARYLLATPGEAAACPTAESVLEAWHDLGCPVAAIVCVEAVLAPVAELLEAIR